MPFYGITCIMYNYYFTCPKYVLKDTQKCKYYKIILPINHYFFNSFPTNFNLFPTRFENFVRFAALDEKKERYQFLKIMHGDFSLSK